MPRGSPVGWLLTTRRPTLIPFLAEEGELETLAARKRRNDRQSRRALDGHVERDGGPVDHHGAAFGRAADLPEHGPDRGPDRNPRPTLFDGTAARDVHHDVDGFGPGRAAPG